MRWSIKREILPLGVMIALLVLSFYFYPGLPDTVASHFNSRGVPDGYMPKPQFFLLFGGLIAGLYLLLTFIPLIDPFWRKIQPRYGIFLMMRDLAMLFFLFMFVLAIVGARTGALPVQALNIGFGLLFVLLGNWLPKLPRNFFFGIRTPWTLASEEVWKKSHILGGWLFVAGGIALIILSLFGANPVIALTVTLTPVVLVGAIIYPFALYKKLQKEGRMSAPEL